MRRSLSYKIILGHIIKFLSNYSIKNILKKIRFEPKIIIGSVFGFIVSIIGLIAIFFPSFFNLERQSIRELSIVLNTIDDDVKLHSFLENNQEKIIKLSIIYYESQRRFALDWLDFYTKNQNNAIDPIKEKLIPGYSLAKINNNSVVLSRVLMKNKYTRQMGAIGIWIEGNLNKKDINNK